MAINIRNIRKSFGNRHVLEGIDFDFETGSVNMIIGRSGSGKTVLLKCLVGLLIPDTGSIVYDGQELTKLSASGLRALRKQIGMLFQSAALFDSMTVAQNVAFPLRMFTNKTAREIQSRVAFCLERVSLSHAMELFPAEISGGMKKRVGIARAIALNPKYLFCDEPNSGLDPQTGALIDELIKELTREFKMTTVVISHDMKSVMTIGDRIMFLHKGHKAWEGPAEAVANCNNEILLEYISTSGVSLVVE